MAIHKQMGDVMVAPSTTYHTVYEQWSSLQLKVPC